MRAVTDIFQMMMMMREHTYSWASEPAVCTVLPRAIKQLPRGRTALLTPPSAVTCGSSHLNWLIMSLSGHWQMTHPSLDSTAPLRLLILTSSSLIFATSVCVGWVCVGVWVNVCVSQIFVSYRRKLRFHFKYPAEDETSVEKILIIIQLFYMYIGFYGVLFLF